MQTRPKFTLPVPGNQDAKPVVPIAVAPIAVPLPVKETVFAALDRHSHANIAQATLGLAPSVFGEAWMDWAVHLVVSPGKQLQLAHKAMLNLQSLWSSAPNEDCPEVEDDPRFASDHWNIYPFNVWSRAHQQNWQWWQDAMTGVHGVSPAHEHLMAFTAGLAVDAVAPSNFPLTNPDVLAATMSERGQNLVRGAQNFAQDIADKGDKRTSGPKTFEVGRNLAATPGKVVFRNHLIELIQYAPTTDVVRPEPILIVPAWIMKYYILDLSPENSLVKYLVAQGYTVFIVSWRNPDESDRNLGMEDYRKLGIMDALDAVQAITSSPKIHAVGYCLGGTLLSIAASAMGRDRDDRLATLTLLAAQVDFTESGPLSLFINDAQVTLIEDIMDAQGFLTTDQMTGAFAMLHARDLIWAPLIRDYMLGQRGEAFDLMAWNADATRMPARMHSEYLRKLFLNNDLAEGRYHVGKRAVAISDIRAPIFAVGTETDHVAPWASVYKVHLAADTDVTFVLTSGGHNAGIVSEPGHHDRHFRIDDTSVNAAFRDPDDWQAEVWPQDGSWWPAFTDWLLVRSDKDVPPPPMGQTKGPYKAICDAPGSYVLQK